MYKEVSRGKQSILLKILYSIILKGKLGEFKLLRVASYRIIFDDNNRVMFVYEVKHRQEAYND